LEALPGAVSEELLLAAHLPKEEAIDRGREIASDIAQLFQQLLPIYESVAGRSD
jgi:hypothetical protein